VKQPTGEKTKGGGVKELKRGPKDRYCCRDYKRIFRQWYYIYSVVENIYLHSNQFRTHVSDSIRPTSSRFWFDSFLRPCQHDNGYIDGRSQIMVHTDERTQSLASSKS